MIIDTVNILTTYGLYQSWANGILNLPPRKKILTDQGTAAKDIVFDENEITVTFFGQYNTEFDIATMMEGLKTIITAKQVHDISLPGHGFTCKGVFNNGIQTQIYRMDKLIELTIKITVTE